MFNTSYQITKA